MPSRAIALIISDYPIVAATADAVLRDRYHVVTRDWSAYAWDHVPEADLIVVDVTTMAAMTALSLVQRVNPGARVVAFSLHRNEVQVYRQEGDGWTIEHQLPSLLALAA